jgi:RNA polymerase sigma-70 factor, ECF subfamily
MGESEIIEGIKEGNEEAFRVLVDNYHQMVVNTCFGLLHNIDDAEDVAQEVFIEVFRSAGNFRGDSKITTWLYRIAVNRSLNFIRDNKRRKLVLTLENLISFKKPETITDCTANPELNLENIQRAQILHKAVDSLPENQRVAFTLNKYEDLSYLEISEIMNLSVSAVESLLYRSKQNLQKKLYRSYKKKLF